MSGKNRVRHTFDKKIGQKSKFFVCVCVHTLDNDKFYKKTHLNHYYT